MSKFAELTGHRVWTMDREQGGHRVIQKNVLIQYRRLGLAAGLEYEVLVLTMCAPMLPRNFGTLLWQHLPTLFPTLWASWQVELARTNDPVLDPSHGAIILDDTLPS